MAEKVISAVVGEVEISTVPAVKVFSPPRFPCW